MFKKLTIETGDVFGASGAEGGDPGAPGAGSPGAAEGEGGGEGKKEGEGGSPENVSLEKFQVLETQMKTQSDQISELTGSLKTAITALSHPAEPAKQEKKIEPISLANVEKALSEGTGAQAILDVVNDAVDRQISAFNRETFEPRMRDGLSAIAELSSVTLQSKPLYTKYKKEIQTVIDSFGPEAKANPKTHAAAYDYVIGQHHQEIVDVAVEEALRKGGESGAGNPGKSGAGGRQLPDKDKIPTVEEAFGADAAKALGDTDPDTFAQSLGYKDFKAYSELAKKQEVA